MFNKLRFKLTLLNALITNLILVIMSVCFILISEKSQWNNSFYSFKADMNSFITSLKETQILSHTWLRRMEGSQYKIRLIDHGVPYLFNSIITDHETDTLFDNVLSCYQANFKEQENIDSLRSYHAEFAFFSKNNTYSTLNAKNSSCLVSGISLIKNNSNLTVLILAPQTALKHSLQRQRVLVIIIILSASVILTLFSWIFTGKLLIPLKKNHESQQQFVANASHELRTPLTVIQSSIGACEIAPKEEQGIFLINMRQECKQMQHLIHDMLFLANSNKFSSDFQMKPVSLDTLLLNAYESFQPVASEKNISLSLYLPDNQIPLCSCDEEKIYQALSALIHNAISYTATGGLIHLALKITPRYFNLSVSDTGCGIPPEEREHIFERFYRVQSSHSDKKHFGLGLCIVKGIVETHKGQIFVTENKPHGSIFTLQLIKNNIF